MSNLRRLRCYLMACQHHSFEYGKYVEELVSKDVADALRNNPVIFPDAHSVYTAIESLAMNMVPFEELNQFRTRCFLSFASHQKKNLSLTQVLKLYVAAYQVLTLHLYLFLQYQHGVDTHVLSLSIRSRASGSKCGPASSL